MNEPAVVIRLDDNGRAYRPGETLSGEYRVESLAADEVKAIELSVLWYTEGKGDEDMAVHEFQRLARDEGDWVDLRRPSRFSTTLPPSPLSYDGAILKIHWCVRVRVFPRQGREVLGEQTFVLGTVATAAEAAP
jgi:hypothetical protein